MLPQYSLGELLMCESPATGREGKVPLAGRGGGVRLLKPTTIPRLSSGDGEALSDPKNAEEADNETRTFCPSLKPHNKGL